MKVIFYSDKCQYCNNMMLYLDKHQIKTMFKLINIDNINPPEEIDIVPTIVDTELNQFLNGKKVFEYLLNIKYFNNPTNNVDYIKDLPENPVIPEDDKAIQNNSTNLEINKINLSLDKEELSSIKPNNTNISNKKLATLMKLKKK